MNALLPLLLVSYPVWGSILFFLFCRKLSYIGGTRSNQALRSLVVSMLAILVFTPVWWFADTSEVRVLAPWLYIFFGSIFEKTSDVWWSNATFCWQAVLWELLLAFLNFILQRKKEA